jgi:hypothetical protein
MELALNVAWFIIAATSYAWLVRRLACGATVHPRGPSRYQCIIALTCTLAILFPVISLTDDLHAMEATSEETSPSRRALHRAGVKPPQATQRTANQLPFVVHDFSMGVGWTALARLTTQSAPVASTARHFSSLGRSPPNFTVSKLR